jgi:hypothetical protein
MADSKRDPATEEGESSGRPNSTVDEMDQVTRGRIAGMWAEAQVEFEKITGRKLGEGRKVTFDSVSGMIEARQKEEFEQEAQAKDAEGWEKAKKIGDTMATCARLFIGITKQIAPYVSFLSSAKMTLLTFESR